MKPTRSDLSRRLDALGQQPVPGPGPEFVSRLEERLAEGTWQPTVTNAPLGSRRHKLVVLGVAAAVLAISGSVVALTILPDGHRIVVHTLTDGTPTTLGASSTTTTTVVPTTTTVATAIPTTAVASPPAVTIEPPPVTPPITAAPTTVHRPATTVPSTETPTTEAPATTTATTEMRAPMSLSLSCTPLFDAGRWSVRCEWSATTAGDVTRYRLVRTVEGQPGRSFLVGREMTAYVDTTVERGVAYRYQVRAERADETAVETSAPVMVTWPA